MRAIDCQSFAGGFTLGVAEAGFDVVAKRELPGGFGVPSVQANKHLINDALEIEVGAHQDWTPYDVPFVFGNPPCSAFSGVSDKNFAGADNKINDCMWALVEYAARCDPEVVVYESVQNAYAKGLPLLRALHARLNELTGRRYVLHHVLHNAYALGGCAQRRRYFWVASRIPIGFASPGVTKLPTLWDAIGDLYHVGDPGATPAETTAAPQPYGAVEPSWWAKPLQNPEGTVDGHVALQPQYHRQSQALLNLGVWEPGENLTKALKRYYETHGTFPTMETERDQEFFEHYGPDDRNFNFGGAWQPERWRPENPARVVTGGSAARSIHPYAPRPLTLREMFRIQGFPDYWKIEPMLALNGGSLNQVALWPGKGIPVSSGKWIAQMAMAAIDGHPLDDGKLERIGEDEYVWNGSNDHKPASAKRTPKAARVPRSTTNDKEKIVTKATNPALEEVTNRLQAVGQATVSLAGLDQKEAKKARELLYSAAYALGGKVKVRTSKKDEVATGVFYLEDGTVDPKAIEVSHGEPINPGLASDPLEGIDVAPVGDTLSINGQGHLPTSSSPMQDVGAAFVQSQETVTVHAAPQLGPRVGDRHAWDDGTTFELQRSAAGVLEWVQVLPAFADREVPAPPQGEPGQLTYEDCLDCGDDVADVPVFESNTIAVQAPVAEYQAAQDLENALQSGDAAAVANAAGVAQALLDANVEALRAKMDAEVTPGGAETPSPDVDVHDATAPGDGAESATEDVPAALKQPKNSARSVKDRRFDLTQLKAGSHGYYVHRDYASHYFRWGWAARQIQQGDTVLEVGCGQDLPLTRVLIYYPGSEMPREMVCVDLNKIKDHVQPKWLTVYDETNFLDAQPEIVERHGRFNLVTCFEVIEHMAKEDGVQLLRRLKDSIAEGGHLLLSTPVFNGKAAANHIHEWTIAELEGAIEDAGLEVDKRWGTFASYHDVKRGLSAWMAEWAEANTEKGETDPEIESASLIANQVVLDFYESLREFYADDVLANFMAPNLPDHSRNNVWRLKVADAPLPRQMVVRQHANLFTWTCPRCGFEFQRTRADVFDVFIPTHLGGCDGTPHGVR